MPTLSPAEDLLSLFAAEPAVADSGLPCVYNTVTFDNGLNFALLVNVDDATGPLRGPNGPGKEPP